MPGSWASVDEEEIFFIPLRNGDETSLAVHDILKLGADNRDLGKVTRDRLRSLFVPFLFFFFFELKSTHDAVQLG